MIDRATAHNLVKRLAALDPERRAPFWKALRDENVDFAAFPIPDGLGGVRAGTLSHAQERLWFLHQLEPSSSTYNIASATRLLGALDPAALERALGELALRHAVLRTHFSSDDAGRAVAMVDGSSTITLARRDLTNETSTRRTEIAHALAVDEARRPFDLAAAPLLRATLVQLGSEEHLFLLTMHHIISDGWSMNVVVEELAALYDGFRSMRQASLLALPIQYEDYSLWQRVWLEAGEYDRQLAYWKTALAGDVPALALPMRSARGAAPLHQGHRRVLTIESDLAERLSRLASDNGTTMFVVLLTAFQVLLYRHSGQREIRVGVPVANRERAEVQRLIGLFVNTVVVSGVIVGHRRFDELLRETKRVVLEARSHADVPFDRVVDVLRVDRSDETSALFQVMFNHQRRDYRPLGNLSGLRWSAWEIESAPSLFELCLDTEEREGGELVATFTYAIDVFDAATVERLARDWYEILAAVTAGPDERIVDLAPLGGVELARRAARNVPKRRYARDLPVHEWIARHAGATPDREAVECEGARITFAELERRASQVASVLRERGMGPESVVAIGTGRSIDMIVGLLGIMKSGAAYLPLDPTYPVERLRYMIEDSGARAIVGQSGVLDELRAAVGLPSVLLDGDEVERASTTAPRVTVRPENAAYVIYTSGSTGRPKGVVVPHGALVMHLQAIADAYAMTSADTMLEFASISFDGAVDQWMAPLMLGARVVVRGGEIGSTEATYDKLLSERVTVVDLLPAFAIALAQMCEDRRATLPLRICSVGGEALPRESYDLLRRVFPSARVINGYGPTEAVVTPMIWEAREDERCESAYAPIGWAVGERTTQILDPDGNPVREGVVGELYLGGLGLSRGYLRRPDLTAERFVPDPWGAPGARLYRTGDRARYREDGSVEYVGRVDAQIKLRGHRIELGEIEAELLSDEGVAEAVALVREVGATKQLVAYVTPRISAQQGGIEPRLRERLSRALPGYMIPTTIAVIERMPLTPAGKTDRLALPSITLPGQKFRDPMSEREKVLAGIWRDVLRAPRVGATDHFFELGGDSILSLQVVSRARRMGLGLSPRDVFAHPTLEGLARVATILEKEGEGLPAEPPEGEVPLSAIQSAFFEEIHAERHWYNQGLFLKARRMIVPDRLLVALDALLEHHDALRLRFSESAGKWSQYYTPVSAVRGRDALWKREAPTPEDLARIVEESQRSLHLEKGPLFRAVLIRLGDGSQRLLLIAHHLVVDGVSWRVLLEDLEAAYRNAETGHAPRLALRTTSYQAWVVALQKAVDDRIFQEEIRDWERVISADARNPPRDFDVDGAVRGDADTLTSALDRDHTERLLRVAPAAYRTRIDELLLAALALAVSRWTGDTRVAIELEGHGREAIAPAMDVTRTVGWFTTIFPVVFETHSDLAGTVLAVKERLRSVPTGGVGWGALRHLAGHEIRSRIARLPRPRITFNYLGQIDASAGQSELFAPGREKIGDFQSRRAPLANWIEINAAIVDGELSVRWTFARTMFLAETMQGVIESYRSELERVIEHCCNAEGALSPSDFPLASLSTTELRALPFAPRRVQDVYPLTPLQKGMLFHALLDPSSASYVTQSDVAIDGVDVDRLVESWRTVVARHAVLRSVIVWSDLPQPVQVVLADVPVDCEIVDWRGKDDAVDRIEALRTSEHRRAFELDKAPLQRAKFVRLSAERCHLIWTSHHLLLDGWSSARFLAEVVGQYARRTATDRLDAPLGPSFRDYVGWLQSRDDASTESFWRERLAHVNEPTLLASAVATSPPQRGRASARRLLSDDSATRLRDFARRAGVTVSTVLQGAWTLLLARCTHESSVVFGLTVSGRPAGLPGVESALGLFINTVPVAPRLDPSRNVVDFLRALQTENAATEEHAHAPLYEIQRWQGQAGRPLFDTVLVFENYPIDHALQSEAAPLRFGTVRSIDWTNYPLTVIVVLREAISLQYQYDLGSFDGAAIARIAEQLENIVRQMVDEHAAVIGQIALVAEGEGLPNAHQVAPFDEPVHGAIARQMRSTPNAVALCLGDDELTYYELEQRVVALTARLRARGVAPDVPVAILAQRSFAMVIAILAVLQAGGAYVPLEPELPNDRLAYMLENCSASVVLTEPHLAACKALAGRRNVVIIGDRDESEALSADVSSEIAVRPGNLAYVIYTSGSTGRPKGAANTHAGLSNRVRWMQSAYALGPSDTVLQKTPFGFDVSVWEFLWPLMVGARLALAAPGEHRDPDAVAALIQRHGVTTVHFVPSMLRAFLRTEGAARCDTLRRIVSSGEALTADVARDAAVRLPRAALYNLYGPTEASIDVTHFACPANVDAPIPIGRPIAHTVARVLDRDGNELPIGIAGELYLGGVGLARGYHGNPSLTAARFVPDPASSEPGARLYRTGDRVMRRGDGELVYLGRLDQQVKVRGFRIELGEVETQLLEHPSIRDAVVVVRDDGAGSHLVAYVVPREPPPVDLRDTLAVHAGARLPDYMVPSIFVSIDDLPRLSSGKVDRKSLPEPRATSGDVQLRTATEHKLASMWCELLGVERVGARDQFFQMGGHSLLAVQLVARVRAALGVPLVVRDVFDHPRLDALAAKVDERGAASGASGEISDDELAGAIAEIEGLSAEELEALLSEASESEAS